MVILPRGSLKFCLVELKITEIISAYYFRGLAGALPILDKFGFPIFGRLKLKNKE